MSNRKEVKTEHPTAEQIGMVKDLGFTNAQIDQYLQGLEVLLKLSSLEVNTETPLSEVMAVIKNQRYFADLREKYDAEQLIIKARIDEGRRIRRRNFLKAGLVGLGVGAGAYFFGGNALNAISVLPDELAKRAAHQKAEEFRQKLEYEANNTLGTELSSKTSDGWQVVYPRLDPSIRYTPEQTDEEPMLDVHNNIVFPARNIFERFNRGRKIGVQFDSYVRTDGVSVPKLTLSVKRGESVFYETWILRDKPSGEIDNSVVKFWNEEEKETRYIGLFRPRTPSNVYDLKFMVAGRA